MTLRGSVAGAVCAALAAVVFLATPFFERAEWWLFDLQSRQLARSRPVDPRILLVTVSDEAIRNLAELYGRPPYSRAVWALVVEELKRDGAAVIAFDLLLAEENANDPEGDRALAREIDGAPVVLAAQTDPTLTLPHPMFRRTARVGTFRFVDAHHYVLVDRGLPSLGLASARLFAKQNLTSARELVIRWNGAKKNDRDLSYANVGVDKVVLAALMRQEGTPVPDAFARRFRGKIALIGHTAAGLMDLRANPLSPIAPGLEHHANAIDNLLNRDANRVANRRLMLPLILLIGAAFGAITGRTRSQLLSGILAIAGIAFVLAAGYAALAAGGWLVPAFTTGIAIALTYVVLTVLKFIEEQHQTALLRATFGRYVSPQILEHILAHPEKVRLGGERRELTILFSDIRGFTSISEAASPEEVVEMLNEYLTRMVDILLAHGGTLDKFIGDAVMGFWNAPAPDPDHARHAVACAVEMVQETARLRARWEGEGKAAIRIGVGVNTGEAVAGNIGSERVFGYTVIGDAVNLASRLESKNKDYGTEIIVSESTLARMGEGFETVTLDEVKVKGKERAVKIYEVKGTR